ncbi:MAG: TIGR03943 family protein [Clostridiales bacterium]|nr:TIGR03943 family protein [Clostridiales bacterium]
MAQNPIPVYLIAGFLDGGKTNFIAPMLSGKDFTEDEHTLLIVTEEGEEEYDLDALRRRDVRVEYIDGEEEFTRERLAKLDAKYQPSQIVIEYNGMWQIAATQDVFPDHWTLYQIVTIIESPTFNSYAKNMASLMMEKLRLADLIVFNRCTDELAPMLRQRNIKLLNRRAEIYLEFDGERMEEYDDGSVCPFDLSKPVLELSDEDFGFWYTDCQDKPDRYEGKLVRFHGMVAQSPKFPRGSYAVGRFAMVCCAQDTAFLGMLCYGPEQKKLKNKDWVEVTARVRIKNLRVLGGEGPVLYTTEVKPATAPEDAMVYF